MEQGACTPFLGLCFSNKVDLSLVFSVIIFIAGVFINSYVERVKDRSEQLKIDTAAKGVRRRYLVALSEEVGLNVQSLEKFVAKFPSSSEVSLFLRQNKRNRPILTFTFSQNIFQNRTEILEGLSDIIIRNIVEFYGKMAELSIDCESVDYSGFTTISDNGREALLLDIQSETKIAFQQGRSLRDAIAQHLLDTKK